ncbi:unnamed protein product [Hermetia illucens]|uniref:Peptidase S1 domain-containing protein n=1 Tax=Hermetia illucens TaxID=343691 RepID=A0A7R8YYA0_HERIL|nr:chymotrypsin-like protease CTRL-1 [Hermetia illucens]CAD7088742.1 unnamed protein product [Hermetia illucens]
MKAFSSLLITCGIAGILLQISFAKPQARILDGTPVDTLRRFPHYVTITRGNSEDSKYCGASIISDQWILTALRCVDQGEFTIHFLIKNLHGSARSFAITLDEFSVVPYPTDYDNIALIKLPITLQFSEYLAPIQYSGIKGDYSGKNNGFVVMPGFSPGQTDALTYGMFKLTSSNQCRAIYGNLFDEYLDICTVGWGNSNQMPCEGNEGGGLVFGWPREPRLVGIFSSPTKCVSGNPAIYVKLSEYESWINQTIQNYKVEPVKY